MKKKPRAHKSSLDKEERELLASFERGEWETIEEAKKEKGSLNMENSSSFPHLKS